jgi:ATP-dependent DNA helicase PIF1
LSFGGISIIMMGDFAQLPPVTDMPLYADKAEKMQPYQVKGSLLFNLFEKTIIFDEIMRQQGDDQKEFRECLDKLSNGKFDQKDWKWLKKRELYELDNFTLDQREDFLNNAVMLCSMNKDLKQYNIRRIKGLETPIAPVKSQNNCAEAAKAPSTKAQGLLSQILVAKKCQVLINSNLWKEAGLTNGARGEVRYIIYAKGKKPPDLPSAIIVHVPQYKGPSFLPGEDKCVPIVPLTRVWYMNGKPCTRLMLPLAPAYAISIHKSQGMSLNKVIVNIGNREFANGLTYTAISRCTKIENLAFYPLYSYTRFRSIFRSSIFKTRELYDKKEQKSDEQMTLEMNIN